MKQASTPLLWLTSILVAAPLMAQPSIGGGTCSTSTLTGNYAVQINGRTLTRLAAQDRTASGSGSAVSVTGANVTGVLQAIGTVNFDGTSAATFTLTESTIAQPTATPLNWTGTYTVQSNCFTIVTIASGGPALNLMPYNNGSAFTLTGGDSTYTYSGTGNTQAAGCSTSTLAGEYQITLNQGYLGFGPGNAGGAATALGVAQIDGAGNFTSFVNTLSANGLILGATGSTTVTATGTYSLGANCIGSGTLTGTGFGTVNFSISVYTGNSTLSQQMFVAISAPTLKLMAAGTAIWVGPVSSGASLDRGHRGIVGALAKLFHSAAGKGERS